VGPRRVSSKSPEMTIRKRMKGIGISRALL
jgi:hypothetical protein